MIDLQSLIYVSWAVRPLSRLETDHLVDCARTRNAREGITGVLLYSHGNFMQYLEGPADNLENVYEIIRADSKHQGIIELLREPILQREFPGWSMAFRSISAFGMSNPLELDAKFSPRSAHPWSGSSAAYTLLSKFWNKGIVPGYAQVHRGNGQSVALPA